MPSTPLRLYDTYARGLREFVSIHAPDVGVYCCGLTVYDYAHVGNLRMYIFEDLLVWAQVRALGYDIEDTATGPVARERS